ncbi:MAG: ATP phosphoribosyltransferase regulatory subunit [Lachnospiraceae bacterium]|nr:ATP phosphoribosyltransferase regulatory subunit [Lachnospiraceae bacterium]
MKNNRIHTPFGVRDMLYDECMVKKTITAKIDKVFRGYGYKEVETPTFEYIEVFSDEKMGGTSPQDMYKISDRDGAVLALRSDMTPPIARVAATVYAEEKIMRFSYFGNAFRFNASFQGKLSEFSQAGVELMGANSAQADAEVLAVACESLMASGLKDFKIMVGEVDFFKGVLKETGLSEEDCITLQELVANRNYVGVEQMIEKHSLNATTEELLRNLPRLVGGADVLEKAARYTNDAGALASLEKMKRIYDVLRFYDVDKYISFDLGMVNRLNYYTGIIFRGYTYGSGYSVIDGGRYDNLVELYGKKMPSVGFCIKINEIITALSRQEINVVEEPVRALFACDHEAVETAVRSADMYRKKGMIVEASLLGSGLAKNMKYAKDKGFSHILYFTDKGTVKLSSFKDEMGGYTVEVPVSQLTAMEKEEAE